jgi:hypothetical protein
VTDVWDRQLHLKNAELHPCLGELPVPMLDCMSSRGPDMACSTGSRARCRFGGQEARRWRETGFD